MLVLAEVPKAVMATVRTIVFGLSVGNDNGVQRTSMSVANVFKIFFTCPLVSFLRCCMSGRKSAALSTPQMLQSSSSSSVEQCVDALERRLELIDGSIKKIVGRNYDQLLQTAAVTAKLKGSLRTVQQGISQVETAALHVRQLVLEPLKKMQQRSVQLERIHAAGVLLGCCLCFICHRGH